MGAAHLRHKRSPKACCAYLADFGRGYRAGAVPAMGHLLRHSSLRRISNIFTRAGRRQIAAVVRRRRGRRRFSRAYHKRRNHTHIGHAHPLASCSHGRQRPPNRPGLCAAFRRDRRRRGTSRSCDTLPRAPGSSMPTPQPRRASCSQWTTGLPAFRRVISSGVAPSN